MDKQKTRSNLVWLVFIVFVILIAFLAKGLYLNPNLLPSQIINKPFPDFSLRSIEPNSTLKTRKDIMGQPALVHVWATWCQICLQEHEQWMAIVTKHKPVVYGVNYKDYPERVQKWLQDQGSPYQFSLDDRTGSLGLDLGVYGTPETYCFDSNGIVLARHVGPIDLETFEKVFLPHLSKVVPAS